MRVIACASYLALPGVLQGSFWRCSTLSNCQITLTAYLVAHSLSLPEQVEAMVNYIVDEPAADASDKLKLVYPYKVP